MSEKKESASGLKAKASRAKGETKSKSQGIKIGKYRNAVLLAKGGMGAIYKADHPTLDQPVVLKKLTLTGNEQFTQRFQREATIMMGFQHINIVNYFDHFKTAQSYCMVMEYVDGCSLAQLLEKQRYLDDDIALLILRDTLRALHFAHGKGVIHRDIKPANILLSSDGRIKLTDFGIAHDQAVDSDGLTREGMTLGTPSYMPPEQFRDAGNVDARADIYSAGVLLYECLTGCKPYAGASLPEMLERIRKGRYEKLRKIRPESSGLSRRLQGKAMRCRVSRRYRDVGRMLKRLERHLNRRNEESLRLTLSNLVLGRKVEAKIPGRVKRKALRISMTAVAALALLAIMTALWWLSSLSGILPAVLMPDFVGALKVEVNFIGAVADPPRVELDILTDRDGEIIRLKSGLQGKPSLLRRFGAGKPESEKPQGLQVFPRGLKPGLYQADVRIGDELLSYAVQVSSLRDRSISMEGEGSPVSIVNLEWEADFTPTTVSWSVYREDNGLFLTAAEAPLITGDDGSLFAAGEDSVLLPSGRVYMFTFKADGYTERTLEVNLGPGISTYHIEAGLLVEPALLQLSSTIPFRRPKLQGSTLYRHGGVEGGFRRLPVLRDNAGRILLIPGDYSLECGRGDRMAEMKLFLSPGASMALSLEKGDDGALAWREVDYE